MDRALSVVGCFAHPDDETWVMSGSLALLAAHGARCAVWTATRGEAGVIAAGTGVARDRLGEAREAEERAALAVLGVEEVEFGGLPDGGVDASDQDELVRALRDFLDRRRPDVVVAMKTRMVWLREYLHPFSMRFVNAVLINCLSPRMVSFNSSSNVSSKSICILNSGWCLRSSSFVCQIKSSMRR